MNTVVENLRFTLFQRMALVSLILGIGIFCIGDHFYHVWTKTLSYHWMPMVDGQSIWVWPIFIGGAVLMVITAYPFTHDYPSPPTRHNLVFEFLWIHAIYLSSGLFGDAYPILFSMVMVALWALRVVLFTTYRSSIVALSLLLAGISPPMEGLFSYFGLFDYTLQQFVRVPWWLFAVYLHGGFGLFRWACWIRSGRLSQ